MSEAGSAHLQKLCDGCANDVGAAHHDGALAGKLHPRPVQQLKASLWTSGSP